MAGQLAPSADLQPTHYLAESALAPIIQSLLARELFSMASGQGMDRQRLELWIPTKVKEPYSCSSVLGGDLI